MSYWKDEAWRVVRPILDAGKREGAPAAEVLRRVDAAYPFGERGYHPYKMWLQVRREAQRELGLLVQPATPRDAPLFEVQP